MAKNLPMWLCQYSLSLLLEVCIAQPMLKQLRSLLTDGSRCTNQASAPRIACEPYQEAPHHRYNSRLRIRCRLQNDGWWCQETEIRWVLQVSLCYHTCFRPSTRLVKLQKTERVRESDNPISECKNAEKYCTKSVITYLLLHLLILMSPIKFNKSSWLNIFGLSRPILNTIALACFFYQAAHM